MRQASLPLRESYGQDVLADPLVPVQGFTPPRELPGTGVEWNEPTIARGLVDG